MSSPKSPIPADPPRLVDPARPWADPGLPSGAGLWEQQRRVRPRRTLAQTAAGLREGPWMPVDALVAAASIFVAHFSSPSYLVNPLGPRPLLVAAVHALSFVLTAYAVGLYDWNVLTRWGLVLGRGLLATALAVVPTLSFFYLVFYQPIGRVVIGLTILLSSLGVVLPRYVLWRVLQSRRRRVLFVRDSPLARATAGVLASEYKDLYEVVGPAAPPAPHDDLPALCESLEVDEIVLPTDHGELPQLLLPALRCLPLRCRIRSEADFYEDVFRCVPVEHVSPAWILGGGWDSSNHVGEIVKRGLDAVLALGLLVLAAPLALAIVLAIVVSRDGPVFYVQTRVGRYGRPFRIVKFRTMRVDAEQGAAVWAQGDDPRQTALGRLLRRSRLDELPQLANILLGEMSFVGPRPERPEFVGELEATLPYYSWRHLVRPGLTGWAQINYPYGGSVEDARRKLEFDLYYIRHSSQVMDLSIALRTFTAALRGGR